MGYFSIDLYGISIGRRIVVHISQSVISDMLMSELGYYLKPAGLKLRVNFAIFLRQIFSVDLGCLKKTEFRVPIQKVFGTYDMI